MPDGSLDHWRNNTFSEEGHRKIKLTGFDVQRIVNVDFDPDTRVHPDTLKMRQEGVPQNTIKAYRRAWWHWVDWCGRTTVEHLPVGGPSVLEDYIRAHWTMADAEGRLRGRYGQPYSPSTIALRLAVVSIVHQWAGFGSPLKHPNVRKTMRGYRRRYAEGNFRVDEAHALSPEEMIAMVQACDTTTLVGLRNATIMRVLMDTGMRRSELAELNMANVRFKRNDRLTLYIKKSKTDPDAKGREVPLQADTTWMPQLCPVTMLRDWIHLQRDRGFTRGPLFRQVHSGQPRKDGTLSGVFVDAPINGDIVQWLVTKTAEEIDLDVDPDSGEARHVVPHSFRAGFITAAAEAGMDTALIARITGHSPTSPVIFKYVRSARMWDDFNAAVRIRQMETARALQEASR